MTEKVLKEKVSIPSIQVCISNLAEYLYINEDLNNYGLNPFYSGLYFQLY